MLPNIDFGAAWNKYIGGDQSADVLPGYNVLRADNANNPIRGWSPYLQKEAPAQQPAGQGQGNTTTVPQQAPSGVYSGGSSSGASGPVYDKNVAGQFDTAINTTQNALNRLPTQLEIAQGNINTQYNTNKNELDTTRKNAENSYGTSTTQNKQNYRTDKNQIADTASNGLRGLLRTLGAMGAGGSSEGRFVAPQAVTEQATIERSGAGQNFAQNQQSLDTNWNNFLGEDANSRKKLDDWKTQQSDNVTSQSKTTKQTLLSKLADLVGQKAAYTGGNYNVAAQPFIDQANALSGEIDNLAKINPTYTGTTPVYNAPTLGSYTVDPNAQVSTQNAVEQSATPFLSLLLNSRNKTNGIV